MPEPPLLKSVRQEIDYNFAEFKKITGDRKFTKLFGEVQGEQLKKLPAGYTDDNPAAAFLKMKSITVSHGISDADIASKNFTRKISEVFETMKPFVDFLNRSLD